MDYLYKHKEMFDSQGIRLKTHLPNTAVIIEPRNDEMLELVVKNFMYHLHESWSLMIIFGKQNKELVEKIAESVGEIYMVQLNVDNLTIKQYNEFTTNEMLYNLIPTENMLIFQTDAILRKSIPDHLLQYTYVGAPWREDVHWNEATGGIGNGGLSLRRKSAMLTILKYFKHPMRGNMNEDIYFSVGCNVMRLLRPTREEAMKFSVETVFYEDPIGLHKPHFSEEECRHMFLLKTPDEVDASLSTSVQSE